MLEGLGYREAELLDVEEEFVLNNNVEFKPFVAQVVPMELEKYKACTFDEDGFSPITYERPPVYAPYTMGVSSNIKTLVATWWHGGKLWYMLEWRDIYMFNFTEEEREEANSIILRLISDGWG
ncbi:hypothetical protein_gp124 [Bacillus phage vB_BceM_WH1]|nr:hypothetical protein_gp124 [Bacillus phage vB_BceM_WH1]